MSGDPKQGDEYIKFAEYATKLLNIPAFENLKDSRERMNRLLELYIAFGE